MTQDDKAHDKALMEEARQALHDVALDVVPDLMFTSRAMFGGMGYFVDRKIFAAWLGGETVCLKADPDDVPEIIAEGGDFSTIMKKYVHLPAGWINDHERLLPYVQRAIAYWVQK
jgi:TfoX/Sxy family transcriptional regulator of competence genes